MTEKKTKKSCLPSVLMVSGFFLFILTAMAIPSMDRDRLYVGIIFSIISACLFLGGVVLAVILPRFRKSGPQNGSG